MTNETELKISEETKNFFKAEIRNEINGGIFPANLVSALDSLNQYPEDNFISDFGITKFTMQIRIKYFINKFGEGKLLKEFL